MLRFFCKRNFTTKNNFLPVPQQAPQPELINYSIYNKISVLFLTLLFLINSVFIFFSSTPSEIANNSFNPSKRPVTNIERLLSQAHWNHSNIANSSASFQCSLPLSFHGTPPLITLSSKSPRPRSRLTLSSLYWETTRSYLNVSNFNAKTWSKNL